VDIYWNNHAGRVQAVIRKMRTSEIMQFGTNKKN
jgi:hypothetical protein